MLDPDELEELEQRLARAIEKTLSGRRGGEPADVPSAHTIHMMAKAAASVYEATRGVIQEFEDPEFEGE